MEEGFISLDGCMLRMQTMLQELCVQQTIHCVEGRPLYVDMHADLLRRDANIVFGSDPAVDPVRLCGDIRKLLAACKAPSMVSSFVRVAVNARGNTILTYRCASLYSGYALRSLRPAAATVCYRLPMFDCSTSAAEAAAEAADHEAQRLGADVAVQCTHDGFLVGAGGSPIFAVKDHTVYTPSASDSVERVLAVRSIEAAGLKLVVQAVGREQLGLFDELFLFDHRGMTSLASCDGRIYMDIAARRIAVHLGELL